MAKLIVLVVGIQINEANGNSVKLRGHLEADDQKFDCALEKHEQKPALKMLQCCTVYM